MNFPRLVEEAQSTNKIRDSEDFDGKRRSRDLLTLAHLSKVVGKQRKLEVVLPDHQALDLHVGVAYVVGADGASQKVVDMEKMQHLIYPEKLRICCPALSSVNLLDLNST